MHGTLAPYFSVSPPASSGAGPTLLDVVTTTGTVGVSAVTAHATQADGFRISGLENRSANSIYVGNTTAGLASLFELPAGKIAPALPMACTGALCLLGTVAGQAYAFTRSRIIAASGDTWAEPLRAWASGTIAAPPATATEMLLSGTIGTDSGLILAADTNGQRVEEFRNWSTTGTVWLSDVSPATTSKWPVGPGEAFQFPPGFIFTGALYAIGSEAGIPVAMSVSKLPSGASWTKRVLSMGTTAIVTTGSTLVSAAATTGRQVLARGPDAFRYALANNSTASCPMVPANTALVTPMCNGNFTAIAANANMTLTWMRVS